MKRFPSIIIPVIGLALALTFLTWQRAATQPAPFAPLSQAPKPVTGWYVCTDLGFGYVPGLPDLRQRFNICHPDGWRVTAYCLEPNLLPPPLGTACTRTSETNYHCGTGFQTMREYRVLATPTITVTPSPTVTATPTPTPSFTPNASTTPTPTTTPRVPSGGRGFRTWDEYQQSLARSAAISDPDPVLQPTLSVASFRSVHIFLPVVRKEYSPGPGAWSISPNRQSYLPFVGGRPGATDPFAAINFQDETQRIKLKIYPADSRINAGKPIVISFYPAEQCKFGDERGCLSIYSRRNGAATTFISVHSGVGGEGQAWRHAIEGTSFNQAAFSLKQVQANLRALDGSAVNIVQGDQVVKGLVLSAVVRVPSGSLRKYFRQPAWEALELAARLNPGMVPIIAANLPQLVFETCGWQIPGEILGPGANDTSASVYVGIIQPAP